MTDRHEDSYVRKVSEETARYTRDLLRENQLLRALAARLESEGKALRDEIDHHLERHRLERNELEEQLARVEADSRRHLEDYLEVEQHNTNLANLYTASFRLHSTLDREEVLAGIEEIVINLIGSEELVILDSDDATGELRVARTFGMEANALRDLPAAAQARILHCLHGGETWIRDNSSSPMTACIPLLIDGRPIGAIVIFRLLQQKPDVDDADRELFALLATHASTALHLVNLHAARREAVTV
jgi:hypothetical protein